VRPKSGRSALNLFGLVIRSGVSVCGRFHHSYNDPPEVLSLVRFGKFDEDEE
jgi:hypothetical protein